MHTKRATQFTWIVLLSLILFATAAGLGACVSQGVLPQLAKPHLSYNAETATLDWEDIDSAVGYSIIVYQDGERDQSLLSLDTDQSQWAITELNAGNYEVGVYARANPATHRDGYAAYIRIKITDTTTTPIDPEDPPQIQTADLYLRNLFYVQGSKQDLILDFGDAVPTALQGGNLRAEDYTIETNPNRLQIRASYLTKLQTGVVVPFTVQLDNGENRSYELRVVSDLYTLQTADQTPYLAVSAQETAQYLPSLYLYDRAGKTVTTSGHVQYVLLDGSLISSFQYSLSGQNNTIALRTTALSNADAGYHTLTVVSQSDAGETVFAEFPVVVYRGTSYVPENFELDYDNTQGQIFLRWDNVQDDAVYVVEVGATTRYRSDDPAWNAYFDLEQGAFSVPNNALPLGETVRVVAEYGADRYPSAWKSMPVDYRDPEVQSYLQRTYTFLGQKHNYLISDQEELQNFVWYCMMYYMQMDSLSGSEYESLCPSNTQFTLDEFCYQTFYYAVDPDISTTAMQNTWMQKLKTYPEAYYTTNQISSLTNTAVQGDFVYIFAQAAQPTPTYYGTTTNTEQSQSSFWITEDETCHQHASDRPSDYDDFAYRAWEAVEVYYSDEVYLALERGLRPVGIAGSPAEQVITAAEQVLRQIVSDDMSDYDVIHVIYDWIAANVLYDHDIASQKTDTKDKYRQVSGSASFFAEGVFFRDPTMHMNVAVCNGMAKAFSILANMEGIECYKVNGTSNRAGHAWNKVRIGSFWYICDSTWANQLSNGKEFITHDYLFMTTEQSDPANGHKEDTSRNPDIATGAYAVDDQFNWIEDWYHDYAA